MSSPPDQTMRSAALQRAFIESCRAELAALKPGNVHVHADGHGMTIADFERSAEAAAGPLCQPGSTVGARIRTSVAASLAAVACNTNLGIVLLAAPLIAAAERGRAPLRTALAKVLDDLTVTDAVDAYAAIAAANPGGVGNATEQDVFAPPTVTLRAAMALAADRDLVARQYATGFADVFAIGVPRLASARNRGATQEWATTLVFLDFLVAFPDSHIARKFGLDVARSVEREASDLRLTLPDDPTAAFPVLLEFDRDLKRRGLNPGTSADLTVASLLAAEAERIVLLDM
ncbi:MAG: triphosphoribosyl-dephospho-CoA protein [Rhodospirillales bacterium]|nr:triphosphoribosyl-dephospho-CoA protein [Rhodospirillales bacterium]